MVAINYESFRFRPTYWLVIPLLAVVAYLNVLRIGFLSDDFVLLFQASTAKSPLYAFAFDRTQYFYRPVGQTLAWWLNWQIWGYDPLPFHLVGLLLHAGIATLLGLWLAEVFPKQRIVGWLAGALFAVYPLSAEAVGWLADQWDLWAALFMLLSLYLFTKWWLRPGGNGRILYFLALVCYFAALVSKESVLAFLPIYAIAALLATARRDQTAIRRVALSLVPFGLLLIIYLGLRITALGSIGGYPISSNSPLSGFLGNGWDILFSRFLYLLFAPVNASLVGLATQQSLALLLALAWIVGLCVYARRSASWLILAVAWLVVGFVPALNLSLSIQSSDLQQTRFLYIGSAGYCIGAAAVLYNVVISIRHRLTKRMAIGGIALVLAACIVGSWSNLRSWQAATNYDLAINQRLLNLIPAQPRPRGTAWYIQDLPDNYRGAYLFRLGLGAMQRFTRSLDQTVGTVAIPSDATTEQVEQLLRKDVRDSYGLRFK
ncbi:MAG TPA: hypothetical protein VLQ48_03615, partial [Chloroflexia bacterium]|nr:hypothetical protein [Chloroflexia bacterium]